MITYGVRVKKNGVWKQVRTLTNPKGRWRKGGADYIRNKMVDRGYPAHVFSIEEKIQYPTATHYSPNFTKHELRCKDGCKPSEQVERNLTELAAGLEEMRSHMHHGIGVLSGHRCYNRNEVVQGARNSRHITGEAADLVVGPGRQDEYVAAANKVDAFRNGGIGVYVNGGVHVDHRPYVARWNSYSR